MQIKKEFQADNFVFLWIYAGLIGLLALGWATAKLSFLFFLVGSGCIIWLVLFNRKVFRIRMDEKGIEGPGFHGAGHQVNILWENAEVDFDRQHGSLRYIIIRDRKSNKRIKIAKLNFSDTSLAMIENSIRSHHPSAFIN